MIKTILEAQVEPIYSSKLIETYQQVVKKLDPGIVQTQLLRGVKDRDLWQIVTTWESREALDAMRNSGETPRGVLIFRAANSEPTLQVFEVVVQSGF
jgi:heme-degrading monooxygenase HmoA